MVKARRKFGGEKGHVVLLGAVALLAAPIPAADLPGPDAGLDSPTTRDREIECLATAISYEAGNQSEEGQKAVAQVVLNRLHDPAFPKTICGVVFQGAERRTGCQFSFTCDGSLVRWKPGKSWNNARRIATLALDGGLASAVGSATYYHASYVKPAWAARMERVAQIGAHIFYRPLGGEVDPLGRSTAFADPETPSHPAAPVATTLSVWGLRTAVLTPVGHGIEVRQP